MSIMEVLKAKCAIAGLGISRPVFAAATMALAVGLCPLRLHAEEEKTEEVTPTPAVAAVEEKTSVGQAVGEKAGKDEGVTPATAIAPSKEKAGVEKAVAESPAKPKEPEKIVVDDVELSKEEKAVLDLVNDNRRRWGLRQYRVNAKLMKAARNHSNNMARSGSMSHYLGGSVQQRAMANGYPSSYTGENIAQGQHGAQHVMNVWLASSGHRNNIMSYSYSEIGIGVAWSNWGVPYWTQVFGRQ
jgi:uncharacterized protein YkwD